MGINNCIFCGYKVEVHNQEPCFKCQCPNCGDYTITREALEDLPHDLERTLKDKKHIISGCLREMTELGISAQVIRTDNIQTFLSSAKIPRTTMEKLYKLLQAFYRRTNTLYEQVTIGDNEPALGYAKDSGELTSMISALISLGYLQLFGQVRPFSYMVTLAGIEKAEELQKVVVDSSQGFVAMWFDDFMMRTFDNFIAKAITDSGFNPFIIPMKEHNDDICDHIIAEIRKSRFLVADFTGQRGGVYFEAGFAYGLGIPVIWTCHEDWFNKAHDIEVEVTVDGELKRATVKQDRLVHFDINHYNFIVWRTGEELYDKLKSRIQATIPNQMG